MAIHTHTHFPSCSVPIALGLVYVTLRIQLRSQGHITNDISLQSQVVVYRMQGKTVETMEDMGVGCLPTPQYPGSL